MLEPEFLGGTDINSALAYCAKQIGNPAKTHRPMMARGAAIKQSGVNLIVLLALSDSGHAAYEAKHAEESQALDVRCAPVLRISFRR